MDGDQLKRNDCFPAISQTQLNNQSFQDYNPRGKYLIKIRFLIVLRAYKGFRSEYQIRFYDCKF